jgi:hypothetical protein
VITLHLPMQLRQEPLPGDESVTAILQGPLVLAADLGAGPADGPNRVIRGGTTAPDGLPPPGSLPKAPPGSAAHNPAAWVELASTAEQRFKAADGRYELMPLYRIGAQRYSIYWQT